MGIPTIYPFIFFGRIENQMSPYPLMESSTILALLLVPSKHTLRVSVSYLVLERKAGFFYGLAVYEF
jgi:hypothetical protein